MTAGVSALPPSSIRGQSSFTRAGPMTSKGTPMVLAVPQYFRSERERLGVLVDLRAHVARALAQRHGEIGGRDVTVVRVIERADDGGSVRAAAELDQGPELLHARRTDDLEGHADGVGRAAVL